MTSEMIDTTLGRLNVEIDGDGPPAVLWHSLFVDSATWFQLRPLLSGTRRLIVIDGPGHGRSSVPPATFNVEGCTRAAAEVLDALGVREPVDWVGNAWGGHVGLTLAAISPDRCRSVVTVATPVRGLNGRERLTIVPTVWAYRLLGAAPPLANGVARALLGRAFMQQRPDETAMVVKSFRGAPRSGMYRAMVNVMLRRTDLNPLLPDIKSPTLMVVPTADPMLPAEQIHQTVAEMPCAAAVEIDAEGHVAPIMANADELAAIITRFWQDPEGVACPPAD